MGINNGDLIQIMAEGSIDGTDQICLNVFYYRYIVLTPALNEIYPALWNAFDSTVLEAVKGIQATEYLWKNGYIRNLSNGVDEYSVTLGTSEDRGRKTSPPLPSYVTYTFRLKRESAVTRNGYKRFAGVSEGDGQDNNYNPGTTEVAAVNSALAADLNIGLVPAFEPIIVKRPIPSLAVGYQYASIGSADFRGIGSQNTRKPRRGI